jgi:formiminoglutamate deiminase
MTVSVWCELAWLGGERAAEGVLVEVQGDRIAAVRTGVAEAPGGAERLAGLTLPGLANAHSHAFQRALRGRTQAGRGTFWTWREQMYGLAEALDPDSYRALARATFAEMALAGVTLVGEFHYLHHGAAGTPYDDPNAMGAAVVAAATEVGLRTTLLDACYLHGAIDTEPDAVQRRFCDASADAWCERVELLDGGPQARIGAAIHSVRAVDPQSAGRVAAWAGERRLPLHAHVSEQPAENEACLEAYGRTPTGLFWDAGVLSERFTAVHATHVNRDDLELLGEAGGFACLCPTTERDLADGIGPARRMRESGSLIVLGSDSQAVIDLFEEARGVELDERLNNGVRGNHAPGDLLRAATVSGYESLGWPEGGRIEKGALADLTTVGLDGVRLVGTSARNALAAAVFCASAPDVRSVMVGGRWIVRDGAHVTIDVAGELAAAVAALAP